MTAAVCADTPNGAGMSTMACSDGGAADVRDPLALFERR